MKRVWKSDPEVPTPMPPRGVRDPFVLRYEVEEPGNPPVTTATVDGRPLPAEGIAFAFAGRTFPEAKQTLIEYARSIQHIAHLFHLPFDNEFRYLTLEGEARIRVFIDGPEEPEDQR